MCDSKNYILTFSRVETDRQGGFWVFCGTRRPLRSVGRGCREDPPARKSLFSLVSLRLPVSLSSPLSLFAYVSLSLFIEPTYALWCSLLGPLGWTPCSLCCVSLLHSLYLHLLRGPLLPPLTLYCSPCNLTPPSIVHSILSFFYLLSLSLSSPRPLGAFFCALRLRCPHSTLSLTFLQSEALCTRVFFLNNVAFSMCKLRFTSLKTDL